MNARPVILRDLANRDIEQAIDHYLSTANADIALGFIDALQHAVRHIARYSDTGSPRLAHELDLPGLRSWPLRRYPYRVFYVIRTREIDVWRVLHAERDIAAWLREPSGG